MFHGQPSALGIAGIKSSSRFRLSTVDSSAGGRGVPWGAEVDMSRPRECRDMDPARLDAGLAVSQDLSSLTVLPESAWRVKRCQSGEK
jgi:hypothetical protein